MESPKTIATVNFANPERTKIMAKGYAGEIKSAPNWDVLTPDVRFRTWEFKEIDGNKKDGALIEIKPGGRTPVQHIESNTVFCEVPQTGKLTFLSVSPKGELFIETFDSEIDDTSYMMELGKGWTMCWVANPDQKDPAEVLEFEEPGFKSAKLPTVQEGATEINGHPLPQSLWKTIDQLVKSSTLEVE